MEVGVCSVVRKTLGKLRSLLGIGVHICVCGGSSGWKGGRVCGRAASVRGVVVACGMVREDLRRAKVFVGIGSSKIHVSWGVGMSVAIQNAVRSGVSFVDIGLAGRSGRVRWSHSSAE